MGICSVYFEKRVLFNVFTFCIAIFLCAVMALTFSSIFIDVHTLLTFQAYLLFVYIFMFFFYYYYSTVSSKITDHVFTNHTKMQKIQTVFLL